MANAPAATMAVDAVTAKWVGGALLPTGSSSRRLVVAPHDEPQTSYVGAGYVVTLVDHEENLVARVVMTAGQVETDDDGVDPRGVFESHHSQGICEASCGPRPHPSYV